MRALQVQRGVQILLQFVPGLTGQRVHQVQVEGLECLSGLLHRSQCLCPVVHPAQRAQMAVVEALHSDRQAGDTGAAKGTKTVTLEGSRIGLQCDLALRRKPQPGPDVGQQAVNRLGRKQAGSAASDENAVDRAPPHQRQRGFEIGHQRVDITLLGQLRGAKFM